MPTDAGRNTSSPSGWLQHPCSSLDCAVNSQQTGIYRNLFKRYADLAFTILFFPLILPFAAIVSLLIKMDSPGPVLVRVRRLGKNHSSFYKYKFRTMVPNAEKILQDLLASDEKVRQEYLSTYKIKNDPRITRFGRWLRRTSLDELPQVLNVLRGEMSWVGPRDILDTELAMYGEFASKFVEVKPGITGLWQVSGRSRLPYSERVRLDMVYIDNLSFLLDLSIIFRTIPVVVFSGGAI